MDDMFATLERFNATKIAKSMLTDRVSVEFVARHTGIDEETICKLKEEMEGELFSATAQ